VDFPPIGRGKGHRATAASPGHDGPTGEKGGFDLLVGGLVPFQQLPQPTIACGASEGVQGTQEGGVALLFRRGIEGHQQTGAALRSSGCSSRLGIACQACKSFEEARAHLPFDRLAITEGLDYGAWWIT